MTARVTPALRGRGFGPAPFSFALAWRLDWALRWKAAFSEELAHEQRRLTTHCFGRSLDHAQLHRIGRLMLHLELAKRGSLLANMRK